VYKCGPNIIYLSVVNSIASFSPTHRYARHSSLCRSPSTGRCCRGNKCYNVIAFCNVFRHTEQFVSSHDASELYYGGTRFGSRQGNQIFWYLSCSLSLQTDVGLAASATPRPLSYTSFPLYCLKLLYNSTLCSMG
jgi:hypothetical protein